MRGYIGTRLFRIAGRPVYTGISGQLSPFISILFLIGLFLPFILILLKGAP